MTVIACLGWGSLIWDPRALPIRAEWERDGPNLPIEFARQSSDGRVTLVIAPGVRSLPTLWTQMQCADVGAARAALASREGTRESSIGVWLRARGTKAQWDGADILQNWATERDITAVVWTALKPKWNGVSGQIPSEADIVHYLRHLKEPTRAAAEAYIRNAPKQIRTAYRTVIEHELGWLPSETSLGEFSD